MVFPSSSVCRLARTRLAINQPGFAQYDALVEIDSTLPGLPNHVHAGAGSSAGDVSEDTLLDTHEASAINRVGADTLQQRMTTLPGRSLAEVVNTEPGWLL